MPRLTIFWAMISVAMVAFAAGCGLKVSIWLQGSIDGQPAPGLRMAVGAGWRIVRRAGLRRTLRALGLRKHGDSRVHEATPVINGMISAVKHLVTVEQAG